MNRSDFSERERTIARQKVAFLQGRGSVSFPTLCELNSRLAPASIRPALASEAEPRKPIADSRGPSTMKTIAIMLFVFAIAFTAVQVAAWACHALPSLP